MLEDTRDETVSECSRTPGNRCAEEICALGYKLAQVYLSFQRGEEFVERRANQASDYDYVYRARWYLAGPDHAEGRSDLIFYRESESVYRLQMITKAPAGAFDGAAGDGITVVDQRETFAWWHDALRQTLNLSDNVLDNDNPFSTMRASINRTRRPVSPEIVELREREQLLLFQPEQLTQMREGVESLRELEKVSLYSLAPGNFSLGQIAAIVNFHHEILTTHLEKDFEKAAHNFRQQHLDVRAVGETMRDLKQVPLVAGISLDQVSILTQYAARLSVELLQAASALSWSEKHLPRFLTNISLPGTTAAGLVLCMNAFNHPLFRDYAASRVAEFDNLRHHLVDSGSISLIKREKEILSRNAKAVEQFSQAISRYINQF